MLTIDEIRSIVTPLVMSHPVSRVILFGSYARGDNTVDSDVDLIIDSNGQLSFWDLLGISGDIILRLPIKADVLGLEEIKKPALLESIINEGVTIYENEN
jgi:predicted nucleotidyltransferase